ncbi:MAG: nucleoside phosphorylase [Oscillospiraceae bacterium]|nr:nucleoside phosphorylase [Oscillospiraceae bacterium]
MSVVKNEFPILEYDSEKNGVIKPNRRSRTLLPEICVMTFFREVLENFIIKNNCEVRNTYNSEMSDLPVYVVKYRGVEMCVVQAVVGSPSIAMETDFLAGYGVKKIIACGGCGVLENIPVGDVIIPVSALRDEGASYHYLPPSRDIQLDADMISIIKSTLIDNNVPFIECKTWTTDGFYRETPDMIQYRKEEGCQVVEMECATIASVARFRDIKFGQLLYSGDILIDVSNYDEREWSSNSSREKLFLLSLEVAFKLYNNRYNYIIS